MSAPTVVRADAGAAPAGLLIAAARRRRHRRRVAVNAALAAVVLALCLLALMVGNTFYPLGDVVRVVLGQDVPGASFTVGELRLPRTALALLAGAAFGLAGVSFQVLLRNPLASPDIIGIGQGAAAAAVIGIIVLGLSGPAVSAMALAGALLTAAAIYLLSTRGGFAGTRLILIGIGIAAMLTSVISYLLSRAAQWDIQTAMRWMAGSLNDATWQAVVPLALAVGVIVPALALTSGGLRMLQLGDDSAAGMGVRVTATRLVIIAGAVALLAFATAATGPIAFVAFMSGPIARRLVGPGADLLLPSALVGVLLVLGGDLLGQFAFGTRYPVGVITGVLGAPYLIFLLIRTNRQGTAL